MTFTIVYDNNAHHPQLRTDWGFACLVETGETTVLFDTGADGAILLDNVAQLGFDPRAVDVVVLSHVHGDHTGGLMALLNQGATPQVYAPTAFPASFKDQIRTQAALIEVSGPIEILPGFYSTGEVGSSIVEQALAVETGEGWVLVTGCAHPGVVEMVRRAKEAVRGEVVFVMGGFHLRSASRDQVAAVSAALRSLGVQGMAPCHCTGDGARRTFVQSYGDDCILGGVGQVFVWKKREQ